MKLTFNQLLASCAPGSNGVSALGILDGHDAIPAKPSYWIGRVIDKADSELKRFHKIRVKKCEDLGGVLNKETNTYDFPDESSKAELEKQIEELRNTEIDFEGIDPIKIDALGDAKIPAGVFRICDWLFVA